MKKIVINRSYDMFSVSQETFLRLRALGQPDALQESDPAAYWPEAWSYDLTACMDVDK
jgi:hypothetical protein